MKLILVQAKKELRSFFDSLIAYLLLIIYLGFTGFFTWLYGADIFIVGQADLRSFFSISYWILFLFIPALTMRLLAEENKTGTIELLLTKSISDREVIWGKFLATFVLIAIAIGLTFIYPISVSAIGNLDWGATFTGYLALLLMSGMYIGIGLFASSLTSNQIVAFLAALFIGLTFHIIFQVIASGFTGQIGLLLKWMSTSTHFDSMSRGVIDSQDLIYFLSIIGLSTTLAELNLSKRKLV